jgi:hypothetical protein
VWLPLLAIVLLLVILAVDWNPTVTKNSGSRSTVTTSTLPTTTTSISTVGWVAVTYGHAQLRVPVSARIIHTSRPCQAARPPFTIWVGLPHPANCWYESGGPTVPNRVILSPPASVLERRFTGSTTINGFEVKTYKWDGGGFYYQAWSKDTPGYFVPALDVVIITSGPLGKAVLETLRRAPR